MYQSLREICTLSCVTFEVFLVSIRKTVQCNKRFKLCLSHQWSRHSFNFTICWIPNLKKRVNFLLIFSWILKTFMILNCGLQESFVWVSRKLIFFVFEISGSILIVAQSNMVSAKCSILYQFNNMITCLKFHSIPRVNKSSAMFLFHFYELSGKVDELNQLEIGWRG